MDIAGLAAKPRDVLDTLDRSTFGVNSSCIFESVPLQLKTLRHYTRRCPFLYKKNVFVFRS